MTNSNKISPFEQLVKNFLQENIIPELISHFDEFSSCWFYIRFTDSTTKLYFNDFVFITSTSKNPKEIIRKIFLKSGVDVKFYENSNGYKCLCYFMD